MISISLFMRFAYLFLSMAVSAPNPDQDAARNALVANSDHWFLCLIWSTIAVGIGVIGEIPECIYEWKEWRAHKKGTPFEEKKGRLSIPIGVIGAIIVAVAIAIEGIAEYNGGAAETAIRKFDNDRVTQAQKDAGDAKSSSITAAGQATIAQDSAKQAVTDAGNAKKKADAVTKQANDLSALLRTMTPREEVLSEADSTLSKALSPFRRQYFSLEKCDWPVQKSPFSWSREEEETEGANAAIWKILFQDAKWLYGHKMWGHWGYCPAALGIQIFVNKSAPRKTLEAARTLSKELDKILLPPPGGSLAIVGPETQDPRDESAPGTLIAKHPDEIVVIVGRMEIPWGSPEEMKRAEMRARTRQKAATLKAKP